MGIPNLIAAFIIYYHLTETPKFLFIKGREQEALDVLKMMFVKNTGKTMEEYPVSKSIFIHEIYGINNFSLIRYRNWSPPTTSKKMQ